MAPPTQHQPATPPVWHMVGAMITRLGTHLVARAPLRQAEEPEAGGGARRWTNWRLCSDR